jgi:hypothetical protein
MFGTTFGTISGTAFSGTTFAGTFWPSASGVEVFVLSEKEKK